MMQEVPMLESQFKPPIVKDQYVQRVELHKKMQLIPSYPLTLLFSSAGYGKSTGLSSFAQYSKYPVVWLSMTEYDTDFVPFITKLIHAIRKAIPNFGENILYKLRQLHHLVRDQEVWAFMTLMVNELEGHDDEFILILDDAHHFLSAHSINKFIQLFMEHMPSTVHFVLSSRFKPRWSIISKLKIKANLLEITQKDLMLTQEEVAHLVQDIHEITVEEESMRRIHDLTEGWPIACGMFVQQMKAGENLNQLLNQEVQSLDDLFQYMMIEVLSQQPSIIQKFLEQTSVLDIISAEASDQILKINSSYQMLEDLFHQHLFIQKIDSTHYQYHALFKTFLENRLKQSSPEEYKYLHNEAAYYFEQKNNLEQAIHHFLQIQHYDIAATLLAEHGRKMVQDGKLDKLEHYLKHIPNKEKDYHSILWFYQGELYRYRSKYESAEDCYDHSISLSKQTNDYFVLTMAYEGKARIYLDTIRPDQADHILRKAIEYRERIDVKNEEKARLYHMLGENLLNLGFAKKAESWLEKAKSLSLPIDETNLEARIYLRTGRLFQARQFLLDKKENFPDYELEHLPQSYRETDILLSIIESFLGHAEEGKVYAEQGLQLGIENESAFVEACGWMRMGHAVQLLKRYDAELAVQCYENSLALMDQLNISRLKAEPYMGLCMLYGMEGEYEKAYHAGQLGLKETEIVQDLWLSAIIKLCMSVASVHCKRYDFALKTLNETRDHFKACEDDYGLMLVAFWKAFLGFEMNDHDVFESEIEEFIRRLQTGSYDFFLKKRTYFGPPNMQVIAPLLHQAQKYGVYETYVNRMIHELGYGNLEKHPGYTLRLSTLGEFKLSVGNETVNDSDWSRLKSKELLELLITNRHTAMTKDEIFDQLWPDLDEVSANKNFKVTLNGLLKILEPHRKAREESFFIQRSGSAYKLSPYSGYELDIKEFEEFIHAGLEEGNAEKAKELLVRALKLYHGDYLANHRIVDWLIHERERLQVLFLRGAEKLAQVSVRLEDYHTCIHWCEEILSHDKTWEEAYRLLMYCYYQKNNRPRAIKWYQRCLNILNEELGIEPMRATKEVHDLVMRNY